MKFDSPSTTNPIDQLKNPIDQLKVVGQPANRVEGHHKTTGVGPYAYDRNRIVPNAAYGYIVGSAIAKASIRSINLTAAKAAPGVLT